MQAALWLLALAAAHAAADRAACKSDWDCSLNGVCGGDGFCVCDDGWTTLPFGVNGSWAPGCGYLDFLPSPVNDCGPGCVYHASPGNSVSWGGSVIQTENGTWAMYAAEMMNNCQLSTWQTNSQVALATSDSPTSQFTFTSVVVDPWAHNPEVLRAQDGTYVLYTLGEGVQWPWAPKPVQDCRKGAAGEDRAGAQEPFPLRRDPSTGYHNFVLHHSDSYDGPWTPMNLTIQGWNDTWMMKNWNPTAQVMPNGSIRLMVHTQTRYNTKRDYWTGIAILHADSWRGPYTVMPGQEQGDDDKCFWCEEDPFMWRDHRGNWHMLYHRMYDPFGPLDPNWGTYANTVPEGSAIPPGWSGGHAFSRDGLTWSALSRSYNTSFVDTAGAVHAVGRRERPKLIFDSDGRATHLYNGLDYHGVGTYTMVAPLNVAQNRK
eukprot:TRINITY_DN4273_c1_g1_i5.p1 TRINITY_DN4273_c1_g1~~TRINITY_DN4273_c1_g1_i5.p1  ORF type:complete len:430 (+),score=102.83 TRINITY_DN4273_c1_g1_i5:48-1337(+)